MQPRIGADWAGLCAAAVAAALAPGAHQWPVVAQPVTWGDRSLPYPYAEVRAIRQGDRLIIEAAARSFLHHQVRNMVGSLKLVGQGRWEESAIAEVLGAKSRAAAGPTAPACGLYFVSIDYDPPLVFED